MSGNPSRQPMRNVTPPWLRLLLIVAATFGLCACRSLSPITPVPTEIQSAKSTRPDANRSAVSLQPPCPALPGSSQKNGLTQNGQTPNGAREPNGVAVRRPPHNLARPCPALPDSSRNNRHVVGQSPVHVAGNNVAGRSPDRPSAPTAGLPPSTKYPVRQVAYAQPTLPPQAWTGAPMPPRTNCPPGARVVGPDGDAAALAGSIDGAAWKPPGITGPWPKDEYILDGGDRNVPVDIGSDWSVHGLDQEDTVAHFDTLDGRTIVQPSNRLPIYAPRFAAVRKVVTLWQNQQYEIMRAVDRQTLLAEEDRLGQPTTAIEQLQPQRQVGTKQTTTFLDQLAGHDVAHTQHLGGYKHHFMPYEDFSIIRSGEFENADKPRLAIGIEAALAWTHNQAAEVLIDERKAHAGTIMNGPITNYTYEMPKGKPRLRIVKVASDREAQPGDIIHFTLRFDNVGDQLIGNVTILDNLTNRLEYIPDSAQCSLKADFFTQENEGETSVLRWEIIDPLPAGKGGVIRFDCRVR